MMKLSRFERPALVYYTYSPTSLSLAIALNLDAAYRWDLHPCHLEHGMVAARLSCGLLNAQIKFCI